MVEDRRFLVPVEVESWDEASPIFLGEVLDERLGLNTIEAQEDFIRQTGFNSVPAFGNQGFSQAPRQRTARHRGPSQRRSQRETESKHPRREWQPAPGSFSNSKLMGKQLLHPSTQPVVSCLVHASEVHNPSVCPLVAVPVDTQLAANPVVQSQLIIGEAEAVGPIPSSLQCGPVIDNAISCEPPCEPVIDNSIQCGPVIDTDNTIPANCGPFSGPKPLALDPGDSRPGLQTSPTGMPRPTAGKLLLCYRRSLRLAAKNKGKRKTAVLKAQEIMCQKFNLAKFASKAARVSSSSSSAASASADPLHQPPSRQVTVPEALAECEEATTTTRAHALPLTPEEIQRIKASCGIVDHGAETSWLNEGACGANANNV